jgi:hypothetical protein
MAPVAAGVDSFRVGDRDIDPCYLLFDPAAGGFGLNEATGGSDRRNRLSYLVKQ